MGGRGVGGRKIDNKSNTLIQCMNENQICFENFYSFSN